MMIENLKALFVAISPVKIIKHLPDGAFVERKIQGVQYPGNRAMCSATISKTARFYKPVIRPLLNLAFP